MDITEKKETLDMLLGLNPLIRKYLFIPMKKIDKPVNKGQFFVLRELYSYGPLSMSDLAERLAVSNQQLTPIMDGLVEMGFIERNVDMNCRRKVIAALTEEGKQYIAADKENTLNALLPLFDKLNDDEIAAIKKDVTEITKILCSLDNKGE